ncbi:hypothetical protein SAY87_031782 [Trapa incisa]|uniref:Uncharacterized protein n=1 Tax=Trapa incisa TaxID=236973 RepID=A0AAN7KWL9_9MYRT|nr:hypothetical protein SAY87_031782 [Trapa incisa]
MAAASRRVHRIRLVPAVSSTGSAPLLLLFDPLEEVREHPMDRIRIEHRIPRSNRRDQQVVQRDHL